MLERFARAALRPVLTPATADLVGRLANPCLLVDRDLRVASANRAFGELFGLPSASLQGSPLFALAGGFLDRPELRSLTDGDGQWQEAQNRPLDLEVPSLGRRILAVTVVRITAALVDTGLTLLAFQDETARTLLAEERARLATAIDQAANVIAITDARGALTFANPAFGRLADLPVEDLRGRPASEVLTDRLAPLHPELVDRFWAGNGWSGPFRAIRPNGAPVDLDVVTAPVHAAAGTVVGHVLVARDVTRERLAEAELEREVQDRAAVVTILSRLRSAPSLDETAAQLCSEVCRHPGFDAAAVLVLSDRAEVTPLAATPIGSSLHARRPLGTAIGIYLRERAEEGAWVEACRGGRPSAYGRLWAAAGVSAIASFPIAGNDGIVGLLVVGSAAEGAATLTQRMPSILEFGAIATALLGAPLNAERTTAVRQRSIWEAVADRRFDPVFQPIVELATGRIVGYEALTRFHDGADPATRFAEARELGLGTVLENACLRAALRDAQSLPADAWLSLNVSAEYVAAGTRLRRMIARETRPLVLEITEHEQDADPDAIREAVMRLGDRIRTVRLAVDDAGAGFNGLRFMLGLAPDLIKLDHALIDDVDRDPVKQALVVGVRHFAERFGALLVAEGIDTQAALTTLLELRVTYGQGFLLGRPAPAAEFQPRTTDPPRTTARPRTAARQPTTAREGTTAARQPTTAREGTRTRPGTTQRSR